MDKNIREHILFIAPYKEMGELALRIAAKLGINIVLEICYMEDALLIVKKAKEKGINFVIARGATAPIIKNNSDIHVIDLYQNSVEILRAIQKSTKYGSNSAVVWYNENLYKEDLIYHLSKVDVYFHNYQSKEDVQNILRFIKDKGVDVVVGGIYTKLYAEQLGMNSVLVESDEQSIYLTLKRAKEIIEIKRSEEVKRMKIEAIIDNVRDGIISIDSDGEIVAFNHMAENIMNIKAKDVVGKKIDKVISPNFVNQIKEREVQNQLIDIKTSKISVNSKKIKLKNEFVGTVVTFQDITKIKLLEQSVRRKLFNKGHIAKYKFDDIIGQAPSLLAAKEIAMKYATTDETILITGESGTGKEMFTQSIHNHSQRKNGPFIAVNCAELSESLFESELFGYEEGAFTGARKGGKDGLFTLAHKGTIFLDEISEIPIHLQTTILRVIQEKTVRPVGSDKIIPIDVRIIAASNKDLYEMVIKNRFREDLFYRLNVLNIQMPSLKERVSDVPMLIEYLKKTNNSFFKLTEDALELLKAYSWPGNIRELINLFTRISIVYNGKEVTSRCLMEIMPEYSTLSEVWDNTHKKIENIKTLDEVIKETIVLAMEKYNGNQSEVSRKLGVSRTYIWKKLKEL